MSNNAGLGNTIIRIGTIAGSITAIIILTDLLGITNFSGKNKVKNESDEPEGETITLSEPEPEYQWPSSNNSEDVSLEDYSLPEGFSSTSGDVLKAKAVSSSDLPICSYLSDKEWGFSETARQFYIKEFNSFGDYYFYTGVIVYATSDCREDDLRNFRAEENDVFLMVPGFNKLRLLIDSSILFIHEKTNNLGYIKKESNVMISCYR